jgi:hypothetical protein
MAAFTDQERGRRETSSEKKEYESTSSTTASSSSASKRKRLLSITVPQEESPSPYSPEVLPQRNPKRRFQRRNSKCPSMFCQMLSPASLMELQRAAADVRTPPRSPLPTTEERGLAPHALSTKEVHTQNYVRQSPKYIQRFPASFLPPRGRQFVSSPKDRRAATLSILHEALNELASHNQQYHEE